MNFFADELMFLAKKLNHLRKKLTKFQTIATLS